MTTLPFEIMSLIKSYHKPNPWKKEFDLCIRELERVCYCDTDSIIYEYIRK